MYELHSSVKQKPFYVMFIHISSISINSINYIDPQVSEGNNIGYTAGSNYTMVSGFIVS